MAARYWILTIPAADYTPAEPSSPCVWVKGQLECGASGFQHYQLIAGFSRSVRLTQVKKHFTPSTHAEPTRSVAADSYVTKEESRVSPPFEFGSKPLRRNQEKDWVKIKLAAMIGCFDEIPPDIYVRCYSSLKAIAKDNLAPRPMERRVVVFHGPTGTGKSHRAWALAGMDAYPKDPMTKSWDGYKQHKAVVIDEYRGGVAISHFLRWCDKYPVILDNKYGATVFSAEVIYITSNLPPQEWYPQLDETSLRALLRRLEVYHVKSKEDTFPLLPGGCLE